MKSIRLAMIVYFLALLTGAFGAVAWAVYQTTSQTLEARQASSRKNLELMYEAECKNELRRLDQRLLRQAHTLAGLAQFSRIHFETLLSPLGMLAAAGQPQPNLSLYLWWAEGCYAPMASQIYRLHQTELASEGFDGMDIRIASAEDVMPAGEDGQPHDYFQTYNVMGRPLEHSASLGGFRLSLEDEVRRKAQIMEWVDTVEIQPGKEVRRVTLKTAVPMRRFFGSFLPALWLSRASQPVFNKGPRKGFLLRPGFDFPPPPVAPQTPPVMFIQYARDTTQLKATLDRLATKLKEDLDREENDTAQALAGLRSRLGWIFGLTFLAVVAGGYWLVQAGLIPLRRLSDAVSRVSEKDFRLQVDEKRLPTELRPIASRLTHTLEQLKRAFAREKQAAADISHELRTPLAALLTTLDVALRKPRSTEEYQEVLEDCQASGKQMTQLVERMLALARLDAGVDTLRPREVDVTKLASQCADMVRPLADARGVEVRLHTNEPAVIQADPDKLREVLNNLLHNAIEYNRPNGSIDLAVERQNGTLCLEVRDTGIGIAPEAREHIFERFFRADPSRHAESMHAGIGLAIVKGYIDLMGGSIGVESSDAGSTFRVRFPVA